MKYLLDTNICIYFIKGKFNLAEKIKKVGFKNLCISEITIAELKFGASKSTMINENKKLIREFIKHFNQVPIINSLDIFGDEKARLQSEGNIVDDFDLLIGSTAIANDMILVTNNEKHFTRLKNIRIENWTK